MINETYIYVIFTPFRIQNAQRGPPFSLITAHKVGVLNEKRCKGGGHSGNRRFPYFNKYLFYNIKCQIGEQMETQTGLKIPI